MKLLWRDGWIDAPAPNRVPHSILIEVEATVPIAPLGAAHGRRIENPVRKVASFTVTDGPAATVRKARSKRAEPRFTGDYHLVAVLGRTLPEDGEGKPQRVVALAPRAPRCAGFMLVREELTRLVDHDFGEPGLRALSASVASEAAALAPHTTQTYLYSAMDPPAALTSALDRGLEAPAVAGGVTEPVRPPATHQPPHTTLAIGAPGPTGSGELAILGAGDYVRIEVAPALAEAPLRRAIIADREPQIAALAAADLGFAGATTDARAAIDALEGRGFVVVATAHDSHAALAAHALAAGHRVICEKPAVVTAEDLDLLTAAAAAAPGELEVGFNRRHNPMVERARREIAKESGPATIVATIREVDITPDHWYLWPNQGTRVAGNLCHWIDLSLHLLGPGPEPVEVAVSGRVSDEPTGIDAERAFSISFDDGSTASLVPTVRGDSTRGVQEQIEIRRGSLTIRIDDLWRIHGLRSGRTIRRRTLWRDKGHGQMYEEAMRRFGAGQPAAYPAADIRRVSAVQIAATELLLAELPAGGVEDLLERSRER